MLMDLMDHKVDRESPALPALLTLIIPTYNRAESLQRCIASLGRLDVENGRIELIIVDDGSCPPSEPKLTGLQEWRVTVLRQENRGPAAARNLGAKQANGRFLAFIDDDCAVPRDWYQTVLRHLDEHAMLGGVTINREPGLLPQTSQVLVDFLYHYYNKMKPAAQFLTTNNMIVPAALFRKIGGFSEHFKKAAAEDRDFCARWLHAGYPIRQLDEIKIDHYHKMTLFSFSRQHFYYGYGAFTYHESKKEYSSERVQLEPFRFYTDLIMFPFKVRSETFFQAIFQSLFLVFSQILNGFGYFSARFGRES